jgi:hypothetical protein
MEEPSEEWKIEEYPSEDNGGKIGWFLNKGLGLGKKVLITGILVSSTPLVLPPLLVISAIGFAASIPSGLFLASYACSERLMTKLLPWPASPPFVQEFGMASDDEEVEEEGVGFGGYIGMEKEEEEQMEETKREVEMRIELDDKEMEENEDEQGLVEDVDDILEENRYEEDAFEYLDEKEEDTLEEIHLGLREDDKEEPAVEEKRDEEPVDEGAKRLVVVIEDDEESGNIIEVSETPFEVTNVVLEDVGECLDEKPLEEINKVKQLGLREDEKEEPALEEKRDEQPVDEGTKGLVVVIEDDEESGNRIEVSETPFEVTNVVLEDVGECLDEKPLEEINKVKQLGLREDEKEEPALEEKRDEQPVDEGTEGLVVVIEDDEESGNRIEELETPFEVTTVVLEDTGGHERVNEEEELVRETRGLIETLRDEGKANDAVEEDKQCVEERQRGTEEGNQKIVKSAEEMRIPIKEKNIYSMVEMEGKLEELREEEVTKVGEKMLETRYMENIDAVPKEVEAIEKIGGILEGKTVVNNVPEEKPIVEISETINVVIGPKEMNLVEEMREEKYLDYIIEAESSIEYGNVEQKSVLDKGAVYVDQDFQLNNEKEFVISSNEDLRGIADESGLHLFDEKNVPRQQYSYVVQGTPKGTY